MTQISTVPERPLNAGAETGGQPPLHYAVPDPDGQTGIMLRSAEFRKGREHVWKKLDDLVSRVSSKGIGALSAEEVEELPLLYRSVMSSLSVARNIVLDRNMLLYLENLSLRAYLVVYGPRSGVLENFKEFLLRGFPRAVRAVRKHLLVAAIAMFVGVIAGYALVMSDLNYFHVIVPEWLAGGRGPGSSAEDLRSTELFAPWPGFVETFIVFANSLFRHNTIVGIFCFGLGFALGVPTILLLLYNGLTVGAFVALHTTRGLTVDCIGWLAIHGVTEITAILLCGAAGLLVADKIVFPGKFTRMENLRRHGHAAASVVAGCVLMFFIAGIIEGGFRQLINVTTGRYLFALVTAALWFMYFSSGRKRNGNGGGTGSARNGS